MALNTQLTNLAVNTEANALAALANGGYIDILSGTQPASGDTAVGSQVVLTSLGFSATAFGTASNGVITANAIASGMGSVGATMGGTAATWFRVYKSDHTTALWDGSVGTSAANMILSTTTISTGLVVSCSSFTHTVAKATSGS